MTRQRQYAFNYKEKGASEANTQKEENDNLQSATNISDILLESQVRCSQLTVDMDVEEHSR